MTGSRVHANVSSTLRVLGYRRAAVFLGCGAGSRGN